MRRTGTYACAAATILLTAGFLFAGCQPAGDGLNAEGEPRTSLERIRDEGRITVGYANEAPYAYIDPSTGELTGEAPEILRVVMERMGVEEIRGVLTEFGSLIPGLRAGRFDVIAAGMYITPTRCEQVAFSNPTYSVGEAFVVRGGNPKGLHSYENVRDNPDATLGVVAGTVERGYARDIGVPDDRVVVFPDHPSALAAVATGRADAYAGTSLTIQRLLDTAQSDALERAEPFTDPVIDGRSVRGYGAFAFRQNEIELRDAVNAELAQFLGTEEHAELVRPFGFLETERAGDITANELCSR